MENLHIKDIDITLNTKVFLGMLVFSGFILILAVASSYFLYKSFPAMMCSWIFWVTLAVLFNYLTIIRHRIIKDVKIEISEEGEEERVYTVMKVE